jgi:hypothetical protein
MSTPQQAQDDSTELGHEPIGVSPRGILLGVIGLVMLIGVTLWLMVPLALLDTSRRSATEAGSLADLPDVPRQNTVGLNPDQRQDRHALESEQQKWLSTYAWQDAERQLARIPIERAVEIVAESGMAVALAQQDSDNAPVKSIQNSP